MADLGSDGDELFSMDELEKNLKKSRKGRGGRRAPWLLAGLVLGIAGTVFVPRLLAPYLPDLFGGHGEILTGPVLAEERDGDRLLLTIQAEQGAFIASFTQRVAEIGMLVAPGDTVTLAVEDYDPFIENPDFEGVRKGAAPSDRQPGGDAAATPSGTGAAADTTGGAASAAPDSAASTPGDQGAGAPPPSGTPPDTSAAVDTTASTAAVRS